MYGQNVPRGLVPKGNFLNAQTIQNLAGSPFVYAYIPSNYAYNIGVGDPVIFRTGGTGSTRLGNIGSAYELVVSTQNPVKPTKGWNYAGVFAGVVLPQNLTATSTTYSPYGPGPGMNVAYQANTATTDGSPIKCLIVPPEAEVLYSIQTDVSGAQEIAIGKFASFVFTTNANNTQVVLAGDSSQGYLSCNAGAGFAYNTTLGDNAAFSFQIVGFDQTLVGPSMRQQNQINLPYGNVIVRLCGTSYPMTTVAGAFTVN